MGTGQEINRAFEIKRLYDKLLSKADGKGGEAAQRMTEKLGSDQWKQEMQPEGLKIIDIQVEKSAPTGKESQHNKFYDQVRKSLLDEGMEPENLMVAGEGKPQGSSHKEDCECTQCIKAQIKQLMDKL